MRILGLAILIVASAYCYVDVDARERSGPFKTVFFLRRLSPSPFSTGLQERPLPMGAHKRIGAEEKFSPFHSVLVLRRRRPEDILESMFHRTESADSFIRDFLVSHLQHIQEIEATTPPKRFNTEKIYNDIYRKSKHPPKLAPKHPAHRSHLIEDEIDTIMANAAKELTVPEEAANRASIGQRIGKTKKKVRRGIKKAKKALGKGVRLNMLTILLFIVIGVVSGYAGYSMRRNPAAEHYAPLAK
ncbi:hypothetical protein NEHOM01_1985 [Nematocida homosporus]|uniref:uncharacterized protein n=1 Tax=Nematocida homosporus TaxID=1912981 RepID=UPI00221F6F47|nr:uncharacterized protein NEHOM01_1985 [Nematocida homosporus]KAI5187176.1 hypothetical protein NEHOM01_1985 [Nematocida homosporus]